MNKHLIFSFLSFGFLFLVVGCDKSCPKSVEDFAIVQNTTGRELNLSFCKGRNYGEAQATVSSESATGEVGLGSHASSEIKGGLASVESCASVSNSRSTMGISLSPASFGQVKLCWDDTNNQSVIVENYQSCPEGLAEQTSAQPCETLQ